MASLMVVMPCYNEASRGSGSTSFHSRLTKLMTNLASLDYHVMMVDDGSKDNSVQEFNAFIEENDLYGRWFCVECKQNGGKGVAVRRGILSANADYVLVLDADMSVDPYVVVSLMHGIRDNECYIATRYAPNSKILNPRTPLRKFVSFCCRVLVNLMFGLGVSDSQCGFKLFPVDKTQNLTDYVASTWLYDVEILYHMKCQGVVIKEVAVRWENLERESTVRALEAIIPSTKALFYLASKKRSIKLMYPTRRDR